MSKMNGLGGFQPVDPYDWMHRLSKTLESAIVMQTHFERDLLKLQEKLDHMHKDVINLQLDLDIMQMKLESKE